MILIHSNSMCLLIKAVIAISIFVVVIVMFYLYFHNNSLHYHSFVLFMYSYIPYYYNCSVMNRLHLLVGVLSVLSLSVGIIMDSICLHITVYY